MDLGSILGRVLTRINAGVGLRDENALRLQNVSFSETNDEGTTSFMSMVNVEEETSLRYSQLSTTYKLPNETVPQVFEHNPVAFLNLYVVFSFHRPDAYETALDNLGQVVSFLQRNPIFREDEIQLPDTLTTPEFEKIVFELYSLSFEQMNHLWGVLGGKYIPSVMYKLRVFPVRELPTDPSDIIKRPRVKTSNKT